MRRAILLMALSGTLAVGTAKYSTTPKESVMKMNPGIITTKLQESKKFYEQALGYTVKFENEWYVLMHAKNGDQIAFLEPGHQSQQPLFRPAFQGQGVFLTIEVDDVDAEYKRVKAANIPLAIDIRDEEWGDRHFAIVDPNGVGIDIVKYTSPE